MIFTKDIVNFVFLWLSIFIYSFYLQSKIAPVILFTSSKHLGMLGNAWTNKQGSADVLF
jgi:hypothetical protein